MHTLLGMDASRAWVRRARRAAACVLAVCAVAWSLGVVRPSPVVAQQAQQRAASARLLFKQGVTHGDAGDWDAAADAFRRALALRESPVIRFNLAHALQQTGHLVEASEHLRNVAHDESADAELRAQAGAMSAQLEPRVGTLTVHVTDAPDGSEVALDDVQLLPVQWGVPVPVDPGDHQLVLRVQGEPVDEQSLQLAEGAHEQATLTYRAPVTVATPAEAAATLEMQAEPPGDKPPMPLPRKRRIVGIGSAVGVIVLAAVVGALVATRKTEDGAAAFDPPQIVVP